MKRADNTTVRRAAPFIGAAAAGVVLAYLVVVFLVFPVDRDIAAPLVPSVIGDTFDAAERKLMELGLVAERGDARAMKGSAAGVVLEQVPAAGTRQRAGSRIVLHVTASSK